MSWESFPPYRCDFIAPPHRPVGSGTPDLAVLLNFDLVELGQEVSRLLLHVRVPHHHRRRARPRLQFRLHKRQSAERSQRMQRHMCRPLLFIAKQAAPQACSQQAGRRRHSTCCQYRVSFIRHSLACSFFCTREVAAKRVAHICPVHVQVHCNGIVLNLAGSLGEWERGRRRRSRGTGGGERDGQEGPPNGFNKIQKSISTVQEGIVLNLAGALALQVTGKCTNMRGPTLGPIRPIGAKLRRNAESHAAQNVATF